MIGKQRNNPTIIQPWISLLTGLSRTILCGQQGFHHCSKQVLARTSAISRTSISPLSCILACLNKALGPEGEARIGGNLGRGGAQWRGKALHAADAVGAVRRSQWPASLHYTQAEVTRTSPCPTAKCKRSCRCPSRCWCTVWLPVLSAYNF